MDEQQTEKKWRGEVRRETLFAQNDRLTPPKEGVFRTLLLFYYILLI